MSSCKVVVVSGLSGAGKASILRVLEDIGFDAVDNPPMPIVPTLVARSVRPLAIGLDARSQGFDADAILRFLDGLRSDTDAHPELIFAQADPTVLLRRYTETRRRHPLAPQGRVLDGVELETRLTRPLQERADWVVDTSGLALPDLRRSIESRYRYSVGQGADRRTMTLAVMSFAFPAGLPPEADMVFDVRFLRNPHYDDALRDQTGFGLAVQDYIMQDTDYARYYGAILGVCQIAVPRFVTEGKKYATIAIGCTGGRHRSVHVANALAQDLSTHAPGPGQVSEWSVLVSHRDLTHLPGHLRASGEAGPPVRPERRAMDPRSVSGLS